MALSQQTLDHLLEAEGCIRSAIKCAAVNENPLVVTQLSKLLYDLDQVFCDNGISEYPIINTWYNLSLGC